VTDCGFGLPSAVFGRVAEPLHQILTLTSDRAFQKDTIGDILLMTLDLDRIRSIILVEVMWGCIRIDIGFEDVDMEEGVDRSKVRVL
jgi:hypothetical protein